MIISDHYETRASLIESLQQSEHIEAIPTVCNKHKTDKNQYTK